MSILVDKIRNIKFIYSVFLTYEEKKKIEVDFTSQNVADYLNDIEATNTPKNNEKPERTNDRREKRNQKKKSSTTKLTHNKFKRNLRVLFSSYLLVYVFLCLV